MEWPKKVMEWLEMLEGKLDQILEQNNATMAKEGKMSFPLDGDED
jgi:hypothetical protein